jgi:hypothetical protein
MVDFIEALEVLGGNYAEWVVMGAGAGAGAGDDKEVTIVNTDLSAQRFQALNQIFSQCGSKRQRKVFKRYRVDDLVYENHNHATLTTYQKDIKQASVLSPSDGGCVLLLGVKEKLSPHMFPCTRNLHDVHWVCQYVFRLHNRLFMNLEESTYADGSVVRRAFLNYNHDSRTDRPHLIELVQSTLRKIQAIT